MNGGDGRDGHNGRITGGGSRKQQGQACGVDDGGQPFSTCGEDIFVVEKNMAGSLPKK